MKKNRELMVSKVCRSFGKTKIGTGSSVYCNCDYKNVCRLKGYCVVSRSMRTDEMNKRFSKRARRMIY